MAIRLKVVKRHEFWKYETESLHKRRKHGEAECDYANDTDGVLPGVQNTGRILGIPHLPASEAVNLLLQPEYEDGSVEAIRWLNLTTKATLSAGIDSTTQTININKPAAGYFQQGEYARLENEIVRITGIQDNTPDINHQRLTVVRGLHDTAKAAHVAGKTLQWVRCSVEMGLKTLEGVTTGLSAPSDLVATGIHSAIQYTWVSNLDAEEFKRLDAFVMFRHTATIPDFDPNDPADPLRPEGCSRKSCLLSPPACSPSIRGPSGMRE